MSLTHHDQTAFDVLNHAAQAIVRAAEAEENVSRLHFEIGVERDTVATLTNAKTGLEALVADLRDKLNASESREAQLRRDLTDSQQEALSERRRAEDNFTNWQTTANRLNTAECNLAATTIERDEARASLAEAETKLSRFRDILGIPTPTPAPVVAEPTPEPAPILELVEPVTTEAEELPNPFRSLGPAVEPSPFPHENEYIKEERYF